VTIPASVQLGDAMLLFVTTNATPAVVTAPAGWTPAGTQTSGTDTRTLLYTKVATATDASKVQSIAFAAAAKTDMTLLAYSNVADAPFDTVASAAETVNRSTHTTPDVTVTADRSWVVSYWADKSSTTQLDRPGTAGAAKHIHRDGNRADHVPGHRFRSGIGGRTLRRTDSDGRPADGQGDHVVRSDQGGIVRQPGKRDMRTSRGLAHSLLTADHNSGGNRMRGRKSIFRLVLATVTVSLGVTGLTALPAAAADNISFRASAQAAFNQPTARVTIPANVQATDGMLLFVTKNNASATITTPPAGWTLEGTRLSNTDTETSLYSKVAAANDAGTNAAVTFSATTSQLSRSSRTTAPPPTRSRSHRQQRPPADDPHDTGGHYTAGSWIVNYWAEKSAPPRPAGPPRPGRPSAASLSARAPDASPPWRRTRRNIAGRCERWRDRNIRCCLPRPRCGASCSCPTSPPARTSHRSRPSR
jgi:hypothetical protein